MNVSLSSNSATNKTSSLLDTGSASSKVEETGDSKGFLESFKEALGFEESDSKAAVKDTDDASKSDEKQTSSEDEVSAEKTKGDSTESKIADEASEAQTKQAKAATDAENTATSNAATEHTSELNSPSSDKASSKPSDGDSLAAAQPNSDSDTQSAELNAQGASQASAAMSEGNKLLGQLDEANKTLNQPDNGKGLPQQVKADEAQGKIVGATAVGVLATDTVGKPAQQTNATNQVNGLEIDSEIAVLTGGKGVSQLTDDEIRQLMDKGVTPEQIEASMSRELRQKNAASAVAADQSQALSAADMELAKQVDAHTKALNQLNGQIESEQSVVDGLVQKQQSGAKLTVDEQAALAQATSNLEVLNQQLTNVQQQATALLSQDPNVNSIPGEPTTIDWDNTDSNEAKALAAVASTAA
ncbi:MAG TPA: flagellar hook-length control protein FliK, partial [Vibrio sp.]|nr:flagellar hook-length control protein FliK [Vibrio sp.]